MLTGLALEAATCGAVGCASRSPRPVHRRSVHRRSRVLRTPVGHEPAAKQHDRERDTSPACPARRTVSSAHHAKQQHHRPADQQPDLQRAHGSRTRPAAGRWPRACTPGFPGSTSAGGPPRPTAGRRGRGRNPLPRGSPRPSPSNDNPGPGPIPGEHRRASAGHSAAAGGVGRLLAGWPGAAKAQAAATGRVVPARPGRPRCRWGTGRPGPAEC